MGISQWLHFFEMYGLRLNYEEAGVSVRDGGKFFNKRHKGRMWLNRERPNLLAIENPVRQLLSIR